MPSFKLLRFSVDEIKVLKRNYEEGKQKVEKARPWKPVQCGKIRFFIGQTYLAVR